MRDEWFNCIRNSPFFEVMISFYLVAPIANKVQWLLNLLYSLKGVLHSSDLIIVLADIVHIADSKVVVSAHVTLRGFYLGTSRIFSLSSFLFLWSLTH